MSLLRLAKESEMGEYHRGQSIKAGIRSEMNHAAKWFAKFVPFYTDTLGEEQKLR